MSLFAMFKSAGPTGFGYGSTAEQVTEGLSLAGQTILVTAYAVHPGVVDTNLARNMGPVLSRVLAAIGLLFLKSVGEGAATEVFAAVSPKAVPLAGNYLADSNVKKPRADAEDAALATQLWAESEKIVQAL